ncbi:hypothetical protein CANMA_002061 [Candida margitis]|uniref:uncharacterized protein n=1 Tax=Candida margitis TaxID=1775924 RepID=UPI002227A524|nr:uncharacterized protein CANMA_002061 [Candida margitis]KAI5968829.1 hypothetical protein CANMA_002061 [Candida margitis]
MRQADHIYKYKTNHETLVKWINLGQLCLTSDKVLCELSAAAAVAAALVDIFVAKAVLEKGKDATTDHELAVFNDTFYIWGYSPIYT